MEREQLPLDVSGNVGLLKYSTNIELGLSGLS